MGCSSTKMKKKTIENSVTQKTIGSLANPMKKETIENSATQKTMGISTNTMEAHSENSSTSEQIEACKVFLRKYGYEVERQLGAGSFGAVFLTRNI